MEDNECEGADELLAQLLDVPPPPLQLLPALDEELPSDDGTAVTALPLPLPLPPENDDDYSDEDAAALTTVERAPLASPMAVAAPTRTRALRLRPVVYKSRALERAAPALVAAASSDLLSAAASIRSANVTAERIRDAFKVGKERELEAARRAAGATNAEKYERRLRMNRHSAAASRIRRDAYTKALEAELVKMERAFRTVVTALHAPPANLPDAAVTACFDAPIAQDLDEWERFESSDALP